MSSLHKFAAKAKTPQPIASKWTPPNNATLLYMKYCEGSGSIALKSTAKIGHEQSLPPKILSFNAPSLLKIKQNS